MLGKRIVTACLCILLMMGIAVPAWAGGTLTAHQTRKTGDTFSLNVAGDFTGDYRWVCDGTVIGITGDDGNYCSVRAIRPGKGWIYCAYNVYGRMPGVIGGPVTIIDAFVERWEIEVTGEPCTVTFDRQDGAAPEERAAFTESPVARPEDPVRVGFVLDGWYTDPACTLAYDFDTPLTGDLTLYARWRVARTVTFSSRGAAALVRTVADGRTVAAPALPAPRGFVLEGWYRDTKFTAAYGFDVPVTADLTLYARWVPAEEITVSFDCGDGSARTSVTAFPGETVGQPADPIRLGWKFRSWYADPACTEAWSFRTPLTEDTVLYAGWEKQPEPEKPEEPEEPSTCTVRFDSRGGSDVPERTVVLGDGLEEPETPEREGYTFDGWFYDEACTEPVDFPCNVFVDRWLYAGWTVRQYTVTFIEEQTWLGFPDPEVLYVRTVEYGDRVEEPPPAGGEGLFCGWVENMSLCVWRSNSGLFDFSQPVTKDITLTAVWLAPPEPAGGVLETNPNISWELSAEGVLTLSGTGGTGDWEEEDGEGYLVHNQPWYEYCSQILSIEVRPGIDSIGPYTFYGCDRAVNVSLPEGLKSIGKDAFSCNYALTEIRVPDSVRELGESAFWGCRSLRSAALPEGVTELPDRSFYDCMRLREAPLWEGLTAIGSSTFKGCVGLKTLDLPDSLWEIGVRAFADCTGLEELILPAGLTSSGDSTFEGCTGLRRVHFSDSLEEVGYRSFRNCTGLEEVVLPNGVKTIGEGSFLGCTGLKHVVIPDSVKSIGRYAFSMEEGWTGPLDVFYGGTREQWEAVNIRVTDTDVLLSQARLHYGCTGIAPLVTVTFDARTGSVEKTKTVCARGSLLAEPEVPEREDCLLDGWFRDAACTRQWDFSTDRVEGGMTLYAGWKPRPYTVTFTGAGTRTVEYGGQASQSPVPVRLGYRFNGWYTDEAATQLYILSSAVTGDLKLYPGWLETLEGPVETGDLRAKGWGTRNGQTFVDFSDPAGVLDRDVKVFAASYRNGRMTEVFQGQAGDGRVVFDGYLEDGTRLFLMDARTGIPLTIRLQLS